MLEENDVNLSDMLSEIDKQEKKGNTSSMYWKPPKDGRWPIRFIAPLKAFNEKLFYEKHKIHYVGGRAYYCLEQTLKDKDGNIHDSETCPICQKSKQLYSNSTKGTEEWNLAGSLRAKDRYVSRVVVRGNKDNQGNDIEAKPVFWEFGQKIHTSILEAMKLGECGQFWSLKNGRDYNLVKNGSGKNTSYDGSMISMTQSPIFTTPDKIRTLSEELKNMDYSQLVEFKKPEELKKTLDGYLNGTEEETVVTTQKVTTDNSDLDEVFGVAPSASSEDSYPDDINALLDSI